MSLKEKEDVGDKEKFCREASRASIRLRRDERTNFSCW